MTIQSDNGSAFISGDFARVLRENGVGHTRIHPHTPEQNGSVERALRTLGEPLHEDELASHQQADAAMDEIVQWYMSSRTSRRLLDGAEPSPNFSRRAPHFCPFGPEHPMSHTLSIRNLSKTYPGGVQALKDVSLTVPTGMFGLLGPNGAGKSTLMRIVATLQQPDAGSVMLGDIDVLQSPEALRQTLGYLPQEFGVYPKVTAERFLDHLAVLKGIVGRGERKDVVKHLLQQTNLWEVRHDKLGTFSGGMKQRFGIAQALLGSPSLLLVDEPTAGLDPAERNRFLNLLAEIGEQIVVILSTHIVEDVTVVCSRMAILDQGEVKLAGRPSEVIDRLQGRVWRRTIARQELPEVEASYHVISTHLQAGRTVVHVLAEANPGSDFEPVKPRLEDVYFSTLPHASNGVEA